MKLHSLLLLPAVLLISVAVQGSLAWNPSNEAVHKQVVQADVDVKAVVDTSSIWLAPASPSHIPESQDAEKAIVKLDATLNLATTLLAKANVVLSASDVQDVIVLLSTIKADIQLLVGLITVRILDIKTYAKAQVLVKLLVQLQASLKAFQTACSKKAPQSLIKVLVSLNVDIDVLLTGVISLLSVIV